MEENGVKGRGNDHALLNAKYRSWHYVSAHTCDGTRVAPCSPSSMGNGRLPVH